MPIPIFVALLNVLHGAMVTAARLIRDNLNRFKSV